MIKNIDQTKHSESEGNLVTRAYIVESRGKYYASLMGDDGIIVGSFKNDKEVGEFDCNTKREAIFLCADFNISSIKSDDIIRRFLDDKQEEGKLLNYDLDI